MPTYNTYKVERAIIEAYILLPQIIETLTTTPSAHLPQRLEEIITNLTTVKNDIEVLRTWLSETK